MNQEKLIKDMAKPLSDDDIKSLLPGESNLMLYPELHKYSDIKQVLKGYPACVILVETQKNFGHWICVIDHGDHYEHFDSYGKGKPDFELSWIPEHFRKENYEWKPHLSTLLYNSDKPVTYNHHQLQKDGKAYATCGRHCVVRIWNKDLPINQYANELLSTGSPDEEVTLLTSKY